MKSASETKRPTQRNGLVLNNFRTNSWKPKLEHETGHTELSSLQTSPPVSCRNASPGPLHASRRCFFCGTWIMHSASWEEKFYSNTTVCLRVASKWLCFQFRGLFGDVRSYQRSQSALVPLWPDVPREPKPREVWRGGASLRLHPSLSTPSR